MTNHLPNGGEGGDGGEERIETTATAVKTIAEKAGPEAAGLLVSLVEQDRRHLDWVNGQLRESAERDRDEWEARALDAEAQLRRIRSRIDNLLFGEGDY